MRAQVTQLVSDQGTVVVFEAVTDAADIITFACDHRCAQQIAHALAWGEDPIEVNVEPWQILGRV